MSYGLPEDWYIEPTGESLILDQKKVADEIERLRAAAKLAHHEMRHTIAPRNSFTDALDALDAALYPRAVEQLTRGDT